MMPRLKATRRGGAAAEAKAAAPAAGLHGAWTDFSRLAEDTAEKKLQQLAAAQESRRARKGKKR